MNVWTVILLSIVSIGLIIYFLVAVMNVKTETIFGPPLIIAIVVVVLAGLNYYLLWEKSVYIVIKTGESVLHKGEIEFNDDIWNKDEIFRFSAETRGIPVIDYRQQLKDFLAADEIKLCRDYSSETTGSGRYESKAHPVTVCVNKKGVRWYF